MPGCGPAVPSTRRPSPTARPRPQTMHVPKSLSGGLPPSSPRRITSVQSVGGGGGSRWSTEPARASQISVSPSRSISASPSRTTCSSRAIGIGARRVISTVPSPPNALV